MTLLTTLKEQDREDSSSATDDDTSLVCTGLSDDVIITSPSSRKSWHCQKVLARTKPNLLTLHKMRSVKTEKRLLTCM